MSISILTKNGESRLNSVLKAVFTSKADFNFEVIVIDFGSSDNTKEIISVYSVSLIEIPPVSFSHGGTRNLGAQNANGEILVFLTQDAVTKDEFWLANLVRGFSDGEVVGVYGRQIPDNSASHLERFFHSRLYPEYKIIKSKINPDNCLLSEIFFQTLIRR